MLYSGRVSWRCRSDGNMMHVIQLGSKRLCVLGKQSTSCHYAVMVQWYIGMVDVMLAPCALFFEREVNVVFPLVSRYLELVWELGQSPWPV